MFIEKDATRKARKKGARVSSTILRGMEEFAIEGLISVDYNQMLEESKIISTIQKLKMEDYISQWMKRLANTANQMTTK